MQTVLVLSGSTTASKVERCRYRPRRVVDSVAALVDSPAEHAPACSAAGREAMRSTSSATSWIAWTRPSLRQLLTAGASALRTRSLPDSGVLTTMTSRTGRR